MSSGFSFRQRPLLHVGYPANASDWLQRHLPLQTGSRLSPVISWTDTRDHLVLPHPLWFDQKKVFELMSPSLRHCDEDQLIPWISSQFFVGIPDNGGNNSTVLAERLHELFPHGRVLIVIREQRSFLRAAYQEYVRYGGRDCLRRYLHPSGNIRFPMFDRRYLEYHRLIECYHRLFGRENVLVLTFEDFCQNTLDFSNRILAFAEAGSVRSMPSHQERTGSDAANLVIARWWNLVFRHYDEVKDMSVWSGGRLPLPKFLHRLADQRWRHQLGELIGESYATSNAETARLTGLDLSRWGYPVPV